MAVEVETDLVLTTPMEVVAVVLVDIENHQVLLQVVIQDHLEVLVFQLYLLLQQVIQLPLEVEVPEQVHQE